MFKNNGSSKQENPREKVGQRKMFKTIEINGEHFIHFPTDEDRDAWLDEKSTIFECRYLGGTGKTCRGESKTGWYHLKTTRHSGMRDRPSRLETITSAEDYLDKLNSEIERATAILEGCRENGVE